MGSTNVDKSRTLATKCRKAAEIATPIKATLEFLRNIPPEKIEQLAQTGKTAVEADQICTKLFNDLAGPERDEAVEIIRQITKFVGLKVNFTSASMKLIISDPEFNNDDSLLTFEERGNQQLTAAAGG